MHFIPRISLGLAPRRYLMGTALAGLVAVLSSCASPASTDNAQADQAQADQVQGTTAAPASSTSAAPAAVTLSASVADGATSLAVTEPITVRSSVPLRAAELVNDAGHTVDGSFNADRTEFTVAQTLGYGRSYTLTASAGDKTLSRSFSTVNPTAVDTAAMAPLDGSTVGVGQSISIIFDAPVTHRMAVQEAITVSTSPEVEGAFYWISASTLRWRPKEFWTPGTTVTVDAKLYGVDLGSGRYPMQDRKATFRIGDDIRGVVDDATKQLTFSKNGQVIKTMPVSNGRDTAEWATPNGIYTVGDQYEQLTMDSRSYGYSLDAGGYITDVDYATQMSYSGIYIHGAPWSVAAQGHSNTSHGCINVSTDNARWVYDNIKRGDIIEVKNTVGRQLSGTDGLGDWQIDWPTWKAGNADAGATS